MAGCTGRIRNKIDKSVGFWKHTIFMWNSIYSNPRIWNDFVLFNSKQDTFSSVLKLKRQGETNQGQMTWKPVAHLHARSWQMFWKDLYVALNGQWEKLTIHVLDGNSEYILYTGCYI